MIYLTVHGLVTKTVDYKDSDKILTLLTFEKGRITVIAKGVRKQGSKLAHCARLFYCGEFECVSSKGLMVLTGSSMIEDFSSLANDLETLYCASHLIEVTQHLVMDEEP